MVAVEMVVVEGMVMITTDFGLEVVELVGLERMGDIGRIERIFHRDFAFLEPMLEKNSEIGAKVVAKDPIWLVLKIHRVIKPLILLSLPRSPCNKTERFKCVWVFLKDCFKARD